MMTPLEWSQEATFARHLLVQAETQGRRGNTAAAEALMADVESSVATLRANLAALPV